MKYDKDMYGTGVCLEYLHKVEFHTDSCLKCKSVILSYDNSILLKVWISCMYSTAVSTGNVLTAGFARGIDVVYTF